MQKERTILNGVRKAKLPKPMYAMGVIFIALMVSDVGIIGNVEALSALEVAGFVALGPILGTLAYILGAENEPSAYPGGVTDALDAFNDLSNQLERWNRQYNELDINQQNLLNAIGATDLRTIRDCEADSFNVLEYDTWDEAKSNMQCLTRFNQTMESIALSIMATYGNVDLDVIKEMVTTNALTYSNVFQPAPYTYYNMNTWVPSDFITYGIEYAGNFDNDRHYKNGDYYLNYVYIGPGKSITIDNTLYSGGSFGLIQNFTTYVNGGVYPVSRKVENAPLSKIYINGIYKDSFGPEEFGDISYINSYGRSEFFDNYCWYGVSTTGTCPITNVTTFSLPKDLTEFEVNFRWDFDDMPNFLSDVSNIEFTIEFTDGISTSSIVETIDLDINDKFVNQTFLYNSATTPTVFNPYVTANQVTLSFEATENVEDPHLLQLWGGVDYKEDLSKDKLFFRKETNTDIGVYYTILNPQSTFKPHKLEIRLSNKDKETYNDWQDLMDEQYNAVINNARLLWLFHKTQGRNSINDVPADEIIIMPDLLFDNYDDLKGVNITEAMFMYFAMLNQISGQFSEFNDLFNQSTLGAKDINITDFSQKLVYLNFTKNGSLEYGPTWYWLSPLYGDLNLSTGQCYTNDKPIMIFDIKNGTFLNMYEGDYYCVHNMTYEGESADTILWETEKLEDFTIATYGITLDGVGDENGGLIVSGALELLPWIGVSVFVIGTALLIADPYIAKYNLSLISKIIMVVGVIILAYWAIVTYVIPWAQDAYDALIGWWESIVWPF